MHLSVYFGPEDILLGKIVDSDWGEFKNELSKVFSLLFSLHLHSLPLCLSISFVFAEKIEKKEKFEAYRRITKRKNCRH